MAKTEANPTYSIKVQRTVDEGGAEHVDYWAYAPGGRLIVSSGTRKAAENAIRRDKRHPGIA